MSNWDDATRRAGEARSVHELMCPGCGAQNIQGAKPTIEVSQGVAVCSTCSRQFLWLPPAAAAV